MAGGVNKQEYLKLTEHVYEGLFILDSEQYSRNPEEVSSQIAKTIESFGGTVRVSRLWEERKLAYPVNGHKRGTYWLTYFRLDTAKVTELNRQFQLDGAILRFLLVKIDERLEEALVEHALAGPVKREAEPEAADKGGDVFEGNEADDADEAGEADAKEE